MHKFKSLEEQAFLVHTVYLRDFDLSVCNKQNLRDTCISNAELNPIDNSLVSSTRYNKFNMFMFDDGSDERTSLLRSKWENKDDHSDLGGFDWNDDS